MAERIREDVVSIAPAAEFEAVRAAPSSSGVVDSGPVGSSQTWCGRQSAGHGERVGLDYRRR
ncbi:MAG: hypothetical protein U5K28_07360 [Halobacteriales archaeon]|nr:hypothetical protein [Halobacteriales archaeon]